MTDTPETDSMAYTPVLGLDTVSAHFARRLERERDEALHKLELCMAANSDVARIARERDEARGQNAKLRDIAERAITAVALWAGSRTNSASKLRAELDQLKEGAK